MSKDGYRVQGVNCVHEELFAIVLMKFCRSNDTLALEYIKANAALKNSNIVLLIL